MFKAGYRLPDKLIRVPYGSETEQDMEWLKKNLPAGELERCKQEIQQQEEEKKKREIEMLREKKKISSTVPGEISSAFSKDRGNYRRSDRLLLYSGRMYGFCWSGRQRSGLRRTVRIK